jgi:transposase-like protein
MGFRFPDPASAWTAEDARAIFDEWQRSGESLAAFARRHGVSVSRLYWWKRRVQLPTSTASVSPLSLVPASIISEGATVTIRIPGEVTIEIASASPSWVAAVVAELARSRS